MTPVEGESSHEPGDGLRNHARVPGRLDRLRRVAGLLRILVPREVRLRYRNSYFDILWAVISPVVVLVVYGLILTRSFSVTSECAPYLSSAWTGLVLWTFFATAVGGAVTSILSAGELITKVYFPRESLPLAVVGASGVDLMVGGVLGIVVLVVQGVALTPSVVWMLPALALLVVWAAAVGVALAALAVFARDLVHGVNLALRVGFFATPVMYEAQFLPPAFAWTEQYNPVAVAIESTRDAVLCGRVPNLPLLAAHMAVALALLVAAVTYVRAVESRVSDAV